MSEGEKWSGAAAGDSDGIIASIAPPSMSTACGTAAPSWLSENMELQPVGT